MSDHVEPCLRVKAKYSGRSPGVLEAPCLTPGCQERALLTPGHDCAHPGLGGAVSCSPPEPRTGTAPDPTHPHEESPFIGILHSLQDSNLWGSCIHLRELVHRDPTLEPTGPGTAMDPGPCT